MPSYRSRARTLLREVCLLCAVPPSRVRCCNADKNASLVLLGLRRSYIALVFKSSEDQLFFSHISLKARCSLIAALVITYFTLRILYCKVVSYVSRRGSCLRDGSWCSFPRHLSIDCYSSFLREKDFTKRKNRHRRLVDTASTSMLSLNLQYSSAMNFVNPLTTHSSW